MPGAMQDYMELARYAPAVAVVPAVWLVALVVRRRRAPWWVPAVVGALCVGVAGALVLLPWPGTTSDVFSAGRTTADLRVQVAVQLWFTAVACALCAAATALLHHVLLPLVARLRR